MDDSRHYLIAIGGLAAAFVVVAAVVATGPDPLPGEIAAIEWIQGWTGWLRDVAESVRLVTGTTGALVVMTPVVVWLAWRFHWRAVAVAVIAVLTVLVVQPGLKDLFDRERPDESQVEVLATWTSEAFPSGHAIGTTMAWGYLALEAWRRTRREWLAAVLLVPVPATVASSLIQGVHWPSDLAGGMLLGAMAAIVMLLVTPGPSLRGGGDVSSGGWASD